MSTKSPTKIVCENSNEVMKKEKEIPKVLIDTWISIAARIFDRMCEKVDSPFFVSFPQIISNLAFLISTCEAENTIGLRKEFNAITGQNISNIQTRELIDTTLDFVRSWNTELFNVSKPGYHKAAKRVICHPKHAKSYTFNTFKTLRRFEVELKIFEGSQEICNWLDKHLKFEEPTGNRVLTLWSNEDVIENQAVVKKSSKKLLKMQNEQGMQFLENSAHNRQELKAEKKTPILVWAAHLMIAIHPEVMDSSAIYKINRREYLKLQETRTRRIKLVHVVQPENDWNTLIIPTAQKSLQIAIFYNDDRNSKNRPNLEKIREIMKKLDENKQFCLFTTKKRQENGRIRDIYLPYWNSSHFRGMNLAEHFLACLEMNSIFYAGGFGDLAAPDAEPSASSFPNRVHHIQHHSVVTIVNAPPHTALKIDPTPSASPKSRQTRRLLHRSLSRSKSSQKSEQTTKSVANSSISVTSATATSLKSAVEMQYDEIITEPFILIVWDKTKEQPVFIGKMTENRENVSDSAKKTKFEQRDWCSIC